MHFNRRLEGVCVLVVDDNDQWRELAMEILSVYGASVQAASSGAEALEMLRITRPDVLLSDISMPEMDGCSLIKNIRALEMRDQQEAMPACIPAAAVSALTTVEDVRLSLAAGFQVHISKPIDVDQFIDAVALLAGRRLA